MSNIIKQGELKSAPILVTGAHRSGTTWVGKMIASGGQVAYISEPLNVWHRPGVLRVPVKFWYTYICEHNESAYLNSLNETILFNYHLLEEIKSLRSVKDTLRMGRDASIFMRGKVLNQRPLLKDPFAVFSAPWFSKRLGSQIVTVVRHPAAFASSLKRLRWSFDFRNILSQPLLMEEQLDPFRSQMEAHLHQPVDVIEQASLLWRMIYLVVQRYKEMNPAFLVLRHEDLSTNPIEEFRKLFDSLGLAFSPRIQERVRASSSSQNPAERPDETVYAVDLDSKANMYNWKQRLSKEEITRVHKLTGEIASHWYPDREWE